MRMRKGAPLLLALAALLSGVQVASAQHCGAGRFSIFRNANCDAQSCYSSCQQQNRVCFKLVYDTVEEKRFHTTYQTVVEKVNKQVTRTCFKDEVKTYYKDCHVTKYKDVVQECYRPVQKTCWKEVPCTTMCKQIQHCTKDVKCVVRRCVPKVCEKNCHYTVCKPVYEQHCHTKNCHVQKQICETHLKEVCQKVSRQVVQTCHKDVCCQVTKCIEQQCIKRVCVPVCKDVTETCYKTVTRKICETVPTTKTITKRWVECVDEPIDPCHGGGHFGLFRGNLGQGGSRLVGRHSDCCDPCFDPCAGKTFHLLDRLGKHHNANACGPTRSACAPVPTTRKVWRVKCTTETVACTTTVARCVTEKIPVTVCRKVHYNETRNVAYTVRRTVRGAYVDAKGAGHDTDGPGRTFKEGAFARKQVPYTVCRTVTSIEKKQVPYTVSRCAKGAYVDAKGEGHGTAGPDRTFKEGASFKVVNTTTSVRMVQERLVKKVQYTVMETITEETIKKVPYQKCVMVPHTVTKKVPYTVCEQVKETVTRKVAYTECVKVPYSVNCKVRVTVTENVPCTVAKKVKVCVPETVCVRRARLVTIDPCKGPACHDKAGDPGRGHLLGGGLHGRGIACNDACNNRKWSFGGHRGANDGCDPKHCVMSGLHQRSFASLSSTGCCAASRRPAGLAGCTTSCKDTCSDICRENLLHRVLRNRFACDPCTTTGNAASTRQVPASEPIVPPKALPK